MKKFESIELYVSAIKNNKFNEQHTGFDNEEFHGKLFFVSKTCICCYEKNKNVLFVSDNSITPKCATYTRELKKQLTANFNCTVIHIPQWYCSDTRSHKFTLKDIINAFTECFNELKNKRDVYTKKTAEHLLKELTAVSNSIYKIPEKLLQDYKNLCTELTETVKTQIEEVNEFINSHNYYEIVKKAYFTKNINTTYKTALREYLNPTGEYAFLLIDFENKNVISSETICGASKIVMSLEDATRLSCAIHDRIVKHGQKYGNYVIMKVTDNYVQIGCNKYSMEMLNAFHEQVINPTNYTRSGTLM